MRMQPVNGAGPFASSKSCLAFAQTLLVLVLVLVPVLVSEVAANHNTTNQSLEINQIIRRETLQNTRSVPYPCT